MRNPRERLSTDTSRVTELPALLDTRSPALGRTIRPAQSLQAHSVGRHVPGGWNPRQVLLPLDLLLDLPDNAGGQN